MGVTIRYKKSLSQKESVIYFDIYCPPMRRERRFPGLKLFINPNNELDKSHNKEIMHTAKALRNEIEQEILSGMYSGGKKKKNRIDIISYFTRFIDSYKLNDKRNIIGVKNRLVEFTDNKLIYLDQVDENFVYNFSEFLNSKSKGEGAISYYRRFKKVIKSAIREGYLFKNPCEFVNNIKKDERILKKDILTIEEVNILIEHECKNDQIKLAFLFCVHSGLRWCDVKTLTWDHLKNDILIKPQQKTGKNVNLPITDEMRAFIPKMNKHLVFTLPSHNGAIKCLKQWIKIQL